MKYSASEQLSYLSRKQHGRCGICHKPVALDEACRFRTGGGRYGVPGTVRRKIMAHKACAQEMSTNIQAEIPLEELHARSKRWPEEFYTIKGSGDDDT